MRRALRIVGWAFAIQVGLLVVWTAWNIRHSFISLVLVGLAVAGAVGAVAWSLRTRKNHRRGYWRSSIGDYEAGTSHQESRIPGRRAQLAHEGCRIAQRISRDVSQSSSSMTKGSGPAAGALLAWLCSWQLGSTRQVLVDIAGGVTPFGDGPDYQRLAAAHIASGEDTGHCRHIVLVRQHVAAGIQLHS